MELKALKLVKTSMTYSKNVKQKSYIRHNNDNNGLNIFQLKAFVCIL